MALVMILPVSMTNCASRTRPRNSGGKMLMEIAVSEPSASRRAVTPTKSLGFMSSSGTVRRRMTTVSPVITTRTWVPVLVATVTAAGSTAAMVPSA